MVLVCSQLATDQQGDDRLVPVHQHMVLQSRPMDPGRVRLVLPRTPPRRSSSRFVQLGLTIAGSSGCSRGAPDRGRSPTSRSLRPRPPPKPSPFPNHSPPIRPPGSVRPYRPFRLVFCNRPFRPPSFHTSHSHRTSSVQLRFGPRKTPPIRHRVQFISSLPPMDTPSSPRLKDGRASSLRQASVPPLYSFSHGRPTLSSPLLPPAGKGGKRRS